MTGPDPAPPDAVCGVILAAGRGRRLGAITAQLPKPLIPVLNRPLVEWIAEDFARSGIRRAVLNVHHLADRIEQWVAATGGAILPMDTVTEETLSGPAGGLLAVADLVENASAVLVVSGDACTDMDFTPLIRSHLDSGAAMTIVSTAVEDPSRFGQLRVDRAGLVTGMVRDASVRLPDGIISTGMYVLAPAALSVLRELDGTAVDLDFDRHLVPELLRRDHVVAAYPTDAYWNDVGLPEALVAANLELLRSDRVLARVASPCPASGADTWCQGGHAAVAGTIEGRVLLGAGVTVPRGASVRGPAVLGPGTVLSPGADVRGCVTMAGTAVPPGIHRSAVLHAGALDA